MRSVVITWGPLGRAEHGSTDQVGMLSQALPAPQGRPLTYFPPTEKAREEGFWVPSCSNSKLNIIVHRRNADVVDKRYSKLVILLS